ncbi:MAG: hypothetical protein U5O39_19195 [Gammaproteobacteria bacterium]|nr:hypothetical protein [Gammaproteobacteria bacterium]
MPNKVQYAVWVLRYSLMQWGYVGAPFGSCSARSRPFGYWSVIRGYRSAPSWAGSTLALVALLSFVIQKESVQGRLQPLPDLSPMATCCDPVRAGRPISLRPGLPRYTRHAPALLGIAVIAAALMTNLPCV